MTDAKTRPVEVTQADREAAADCWQKLRGCSALEWQADWMRDGTADAGPVVQAFARHRAASSAKLDQKP